MKITYLLLLFKRISDLFLSSFSIIFLLPFLLIISILIILDDGFPVLFTQKRIGYKNKIFKMYKFRSMFKYSEKLGTGYFCYEGDKRITNVGKVIRALSLDELPQLFNIFFGDMSFVGPRPAIYDELENEDIKTYLYPVIEERTKVRPGLTGYSQVMKRNDLDWNEKLILDKEYLSLEISKRIFWDLKIIFLTFLEVFKSKGIYDKK